ncbi:MAG: PD-(D/E)XK nuclease family protein, partial [Candidatus Aenigmatarchaeota archaeon]
MEDDILKEDTYLSFSKINSYLRCPKSYEYRYIYNIKLPIQPSNFLGSLIHQTAKTALDISKSENKIIKLEDTKDIFNENFKKDE